MKQTSQACNVAVVSACTEGTLMCFAGSTKKDIIENPGQRGLWSQHQMCQGGERLLINNAYSFQEPADPTRSKGLHLLCPF